MTVDTLDLTPASEQPPGRRRFTRLVAAAVVIHLLAAVTAAFVTRAEPAEVAVGTDFLAGVAARTEAADRFRFEALLSIGGAGVDLDDVPVLHGEQAGPSSRFVVDVGAFAEETGAPDPGVIAEVVTDGQVLFIRAPGLTALPGQGLPPAMAPLAELGERWGRVDVVAAQATAPDVVAALGTQGLDLDGMLEMLRASQEPRQVGRGEVRGTAVTRYEASVPLPAVGTNGGVLPEGIDGDALREALEDVEVDVEVAVDDDDIVRRFAMTLDSDVFDAVAEATGAPAGVMSGVTFTMAFEVFDLGDPSIAVVLPEVADPVDLTPWALELASLAAD